MSCAGATHRRLLAPTLRAACSQSFVFLRDNVQRSLTQGLGERDCPFRRTILDENELRRVTQIDLSAELPAQKSAGVLQCVERLPCLMPVAYHRNEDLTASQIVAHLDARHRDEGQPRILQLLRN